MTTSKTSKAGLLENKRVAVIGVGKMGGILLQAFLKKGLLQPENTCGAEPHPDRAEALGKEFRIEMLTDNAAAARKSDVILLCVKPQTVREALLAMQSELTPQKLIISIAASVPSSYIEKVIGREVPVVRAMPNTPCVVGAGMTGICKGRHADQPHLELTRLLFEAVGRTVIVDEKHMDAVTGLSASGPAFIYVILESLAEAGVKVGLPRDVATLLAAQTALGSAKVVLETGHHPALLKDAVTTPAGCTIDGLLELEEGKLRVTLIKAVVKASCRAKELLMSE
jgi:pyrroline-5-carboxylate reductase